MPDIISSSTGPSGVEGTGLACSVFDPVNLAKKPALRTDLTEEVSDKAAGEGEGTLGVDGVA